MRPEGRRVLVVEDDYVQAQDISRFVRATGGEVLGPAPTLARGLAFVHQADAAVLDINLNGHPVFPLADALMARNVPIVFYTGVSDETVPARFWQVPMVRKPVVTLPDAAIVTLSTCVGDDDDMTVLLPKLRLAARLIYSDPTVADRLVERLLRDAIEHVKSGRELARGDGRSRWLMERMRRILRDQGHDLMN